MGFPVQRYSHRHTRLACSEATVVLVSRVTEAGVVLFLEILLKLVQLFNVHD